MVVLVLEVHDAEDLGGLGVLNHHHVAFCIVGLDVHTDHQSLGYTVTGRLRALRDILEGRKG
jgi:hypothetical protein